jgi:DNA (cytosine-5)-methyltransferase 1
VRILDLFCGAGGAAVGYCRAGFDVVGVDCVPQPRYPFEFVRADALTWLLDADLTRFDAIHASPPCHDHSALSGLTGHDGTGHLLDATRSALEATGLPWVIENVSRASMPGSLTLCGSEFNLTDGPYTLRRHRQFLSNVFLMGAGGCACSGRRVIGVYGDLSKNDRPATSRRRADGRPHGDMRAGLDRARRIMRMPWANARELTQAIPPAYTQHVGEWLAEHLRRQVTA